LLPSPIPPITIDELVEVTRMLSHRGASIQQLNTIRKHLELLKGGGLAKMAFPSQVFIIYFRVVCLGTNTYLYCAC